jgi:multidrug efflux pump subunit AcrA (membrane-fusion protein)
MKMLSFALLVSVSASVAQAETLTLSPTEITEWKAVQARVESRDIVPARARIGGVIQELTISEGDLVTAGQQLGLVKDDKIAFQIAALDAQLAAYAAQLETAETELKRGETLVNVASSRASGWRSCRPMSRSRATRSPRLKHNGRC